MRTLIDLYPTGSSDQGPLERAAALRSHAPYATSDLGVFTPASYQKHQYAFRILMLAPVKAQSLPAKGDLPSLLIP